MKRVIVTGASSMIASNLIELLVKKGIYVVALVQKGSKKRGNIPLSPFVEIVECSLGEYDKVCVENADVMFHFAWMGTMGDGRNDAMLQEANVTYSIDALRLGARAGVSLFVTAGSQAEYGKLKENVPLTADMELCPLTEYGKAKAKMADAVRRECDKLGIIHAHVRILSVYGKGDNAATMVSTAVYKMKNNLPTEFTSGEQLWDYLNAEDAAQAMYLIGEKTKVSTTYVLGSGNAVPLKEYIKTIADVLGYERDIGFGKIADGTIRYLCADITPLREIGFEPKVTFRKGIEILTTEDDI